jgi:hypothetical protein
MDGSDEAALKGYASFGAQNGMTGEDKERNGLLIKLPNGAEYKGQWLDGMKHG